MPIAAPNWRVPRFPMWMVILLPLGMFLAGHGLANLAAPTSGVEVVTFTRHGTRLVTTTRTVERRVRGRVVFRHEKVYVLVPVVVVHTDHHAIKVKKHLLPLKSAAATVANPVVTVTAYVPTTITVPAAPITVTVTSTETLPVTVTTTITLPLSTGGPET